MIGIGQSMDDYQTGHHIRNKVDIIPAFIWNVMQEFIDMLYLKLLIFSWIVTCPLLNDLPDIFIAINVQDRQGVEFLHMIVRFHINQF